ncbi:MULTISPECIES: NAD(P)H-dependent oxidoreductase [unclassified Pseudoalteromonas]|uniref:FMN-dependent NADH-azoreductase n=1 Tax=unclassified Pseudoalteromonas TaxID=194690 RepID=UPI0025B3EF47|nr:MULTISPECIES: NAD(P)H-dependent oxidoreductase [unclassified Pseudoalteromonas]MDN3379558.1 NAD(P)H-dependent oxidoreductase [Pseudoalteromonas sp. APC 3893]MDN3387898.1 NAD(P)H-dependent oxidoreductase [Pseudoalteromonas sp. APC 4017]
MTTLLHIDASVRAAKNDNPSHDSISKNIAKCFTDNFAEHQAIDEYIYRDVGVNPPPFITQDWIGAVFTPENKKTAEQLQLLALSDTLIAEIAAADIIVISSPMYNYGMPAQLKAWFDQVVRINKTFDFDLSRGDFPLQPLLGGKTLVVITSTGEFGFEQGGIREHMSHLVPHLRTLSKYLGVSTIYEIASEYQEFADERHQQSLSNAYSQAIALAQNISYGMT